MEQTMISIKAEPTEDFVDTSIIKAEQDFEGKENLISSKDHGKATSEVILRNSEADDVETPVLGVKTKSESTVDSSDDEVILIEDPSEAISVQPSTSGCGNSVQDMELEVAVGSLLGGLNYSQDSDTEEDEDMTKAFNCSACFSVFYGSVNGNHTFCDSCKPLPAKDDSDVTAGARLFCCKTCQKLLYTTDKRRAHCDKCRINNFRFCNFCGRNKKRGCDCQLLLKKGESIDRSCRICGKTVLLNRSGTLCKLCYPKGLNLRSFNKVYCKQCEMCNLMFLTSFRRRKYCNTCAKESLLALIGNGGNANLPELIIPEVTPPEPDRASLGMCLACTTNQVHIAGICSDCELLSCPLFEGKCMTQFYSLAVKDKKTRPKSKCGNCGEDFVSFHNRTFCDDCCKCYVCGGIENLEKNGVVCRPCAADMYNKTVNAEKRLKSSKLTTDAVIWASKKSRVSYAGSKQAVSQRSGDISSISSRGMSVRKRGRGRGGGTPYKGQQIWFICTNCKKGYPVKDSKIPSVKICPDCVITDDEDVIVIDD